MYDQTPGVDAAFGARDWAFRDELKPVVPLIYVDHDLPSEYPKATPVYTPRAEAYIGYANRTDRPQRSAISGATKLFFESEVDLGLSE